MMPTLVFPVPAAVLAPVALALKVDVTLLHRVLAVCWELERRGRPWKLGEIKPRSAARQAQLYAQGRTAPGPIVTWAKPGQSKHETGRAAHIEVPFAGRQEMGELAESAGLVWGGRWTTKFPPHGDWTHLELP